MYTAPPAVRPRVDGINKRLSPQLAPHILTVHSCARYRPERSGRRFYAGRGFQGTRPPWGCPGAKGEARHPASRPVTADTFQLSPLCLSHLGYYLREGSLIAWFSLQRPGASWITFANRTQEKIVQRRRVRPDSLFSFNICLLTCFPWFNCSWDISSLKQMRKL